VALLAFKSQENMTEMPGKESGEDAFKNGLRICTAHSNPFYGRCVPIWVVCSDTYTMFKIEHPDHGNGLRDFKWKRWHASDAKRNQDAKGKSSVKQDAEADD